MMKLDIQLFAISKSTSFSENVDIVNNKSDLSITITFSANNSSTWFNSKALKCTCNGSTQSKNVSLNKGGKVTATFTFENITHNNDGSKSVDWNWTISTGTSALGTLSDSGTKQLTTIPRASDVTASDGVINQPILITIDKKNKNYTTKLFYKFEGGDYTSIFDSPIEETQINFILPLSTYDLIPNKKSIKGYIKADTYNQTVKIGDSKETTFIAYANEIACSPGIEDTSILDTNAKTIALTGSNQRFIKYVSKPRLSWNAVAKYESIIKSEKINGVIAESPLVTEWTDSYKLVVTDSRGFISIHDFLMENIVPYFLPTITASGKRENPTSSKVFITLKGKYYVGSFDSANQNQNIKKCICKYKKKTDEEWTQITLNPNVDEDGNFELNNYDLGEICDYSSSWMFEVSIEDSISSNTYSFIINKGIPNHNWYERGDENYFNVNGYLTIKENMNCLGFNKLGTYEETEET